MKAKGKAEGGRMKDERRAMLAERFNQQSRTFILPPSSFILAFRDVASYLVAP
jgi:hypothetical protein